MVARFLILASLAGCYSPEIADCVDRCEVSGICPSGTTCDAHGDCRLPGATNACPAHDIDAPAADSASCPPVPVTQGCNLVGPQPVMPHCFAACGEPTDQASAFAFSVGTWHIASVLDDEEESAAVTAVAGGTAWIGLEQASGQSSPSAGWSWHNGAAYSYMHWASAQPDDGDGTEDGTEQCATLSAAGWADETCVGPHPFLISPF